MYVVAVTVLLAALLPTLLVATTANAYVVAVAKPNTRMVAVVPVPKAVAGMVMLCCEPVVA
jgi:hypothetical protein